MTMTTNPTVSGAAPARVTCWGELRGENKLPGVLHVLVAGQHAGAIEHCGTVWAAHWYTGMTRGGQLRDRMTEHDTADEALRAVLRSAWARRLGGRVASRIYWSDRARRAAARRDGAR